VLFRSLTVGTTTITSGTDKTILYNNAGVLGSTTGITYGGATAATTGIHAQSATQNGLFVRGDNTASVPGLFGGSPALLALHVLNGSNFYQLGYRSDAEGFIANYQSSGNILSFSHYDTGDVFQGENNLIAQGGMAFYSASSVWGAIRETAADVFALSTTADLSSYTDRLTFGVRGITQLVPASAIADGNLPTSHLHFYLDEGANEIKVKAKESDGTTVLTATLGSGGGSPAGSGTEIQVRAGASTFGAVTGSSSANGTITLVGQAVSGGDSLLDLTPGASTGEIGRAHV